MADPDWHSQYGSGDGSKKFPKWWIRICILHTDLTIDPRCFSNGGSGSASSMRIRRWIQEVSQIVDPDLHCPCGSGDDSKRLPMDDESDSASQTEEIKINRNDLQYI